MFDGGEKAFLISTKNDNHPERRPTGVYEKLLCRCCEQLLGGWESYARGVLYGGVTINRPRFTSEGLFVTGLNYNRFKLFQLSLLWRAAVSKRREFHRCQLSKGRREEIRRMLLEGDAGEPRRYGCIIIAVPSLLKNLDDMVLFPELVRTKSVAYCRFLIGGLFWFFAVPTAPPWVMKNRLLINRRGELRIILDEEKGSEFVSKLAEHLSRQGNFQRTIARIS